MLEHVRDGKSFHHMEVVAEGLSRRGARDIEGSALRYVAPGTLQSRERVPSNPGYYHSYRNPPGENRTLLTPAEVDNHFNNGLYSVVPPPLR